MSTMSFMEWSVVARRRIKMRPREMQLSDGLSTRQQMAHQNLPNTFPGIPLMNSNGKY